MYSRVPSAAPLGLQASPQHVEVLGEVPVLQWPGVVERPGLPLQQRQIVHRIERYALFAPQAAMLGDLLLAVAHLHPLDVALHHHGMMRVAHRHRVVVAVEPHQRQ